MKKKQESLVTNMNVVSDVIYKRDYAKNREKMIRRGRKVKNLDNTVELLRTYQTDKLKDLHKITKGKYAGNMDCHIEGDWVLIWRYENDKLVLVLVDTGDHQMIFGESFFYDDDISEMSNYWKHIVLR